ncbi:E3 ubiquitin-protein ligase [Wickerhamomyces ciferrii]|uniref:E3 ubiquitin-protein ligase n=1 Tax=Wickerhamomyces ciferrii (strain ATCC 14091 / BCRC 22168 / CBS 111 / JCM 3599 / NBRC 0793 / NRRL Y-1031 F-60-10) TaxID=1206466 RepID=K0KNX0_WICCF|nr:E3 ubiquitin-protein ligase [Wickerhamomyces ciferrii]CCH44671.1 E3 ubiquitin-protein ligase [Wickerhamomyces ciferrii]
MQFSTLLPVALAIMPMVNAYANVAVRFDDQLLKRAENGTYQVGSYADSSSSSALPEASSSDVQGQSQQASSSDVQAQAQQASSTAGDSTIYETLTTTVTTEIPTYVPTTDANGQASSVLSTSTITYFSTLTQEQSSSAAPQGQASSSAAEGQGVQESVSTAGESVYQSGDSTITSVVLTTYTLAESSTSATPTNEGEQSQAQSSEAPVSSSADSLNIDEAGKQVQANNNGAQSSSSAAAITSAPVAESSSAAPEAQGAVSTVTVTVTNDNCAASSAQDQVSTVTSTITTKIPLTAEFTITGSNGEVHTVSTSTDIDQTTTQVVYLTQTTTLPSSSAAAEATATGSIDQAGSGTNATQPQATNSAYGSALYGNGTTSGNSTSLSPSASQYSITASDYASNGSVQKRSFLRRIIGY